jgi:ABC-type antimicrobial peptide transport system permease subunit
LLAAIGVYGLVWHSVSVRVREIGVRMALGATSTRIARLIAGEIVPVLTAGLVLGIGAAVIAARLLQSQLFGISAFDPTTLIGTIVIFAVCTIIACAAPLRRAMLVDPIVAIKLD